MTRTDAYVGLCRTAARMMAVSRSHGCDSSLYLWLASQREKFRTQLGRCEDGLMVSPHIPWWMQAKVRSERLERAPF